MPRPQMTGKVSEDKRGADSAKDVQQVNASSSRSPDAVNGGHVQSHFHSSDLRLGSNYAEESKLSLHYQL